MFSNCLFEALKAKIKDPKNVKIHKIKYLEPTSVCPHFWWEKGDKAYNFVSRKPRRLQVIMFAGDIAEAPLSTYLEFANACDANYEASFLSDKQKPNVSE